MMSQQNINEPVNNQNIKQDTQPWYKQGWPWFVISFPILTVFAGIATYIIAANQPHSMVQDDYFKKGLAINQSIEKQELAIRKNLTALINAKQDSGLVSIDLQGDNITASQLQLVFSHPTQTTRDRQITLDRLAANEFVGQLPELPQAFWHIRLSDQNDSWHLKSRWHFPENSQLHIKSQKSIRQ